MRLFRILLVCVFLLVASSIYAQDDDRNLLENPSFELPYLEQGGNPIRQVAQGWIAWHTERQPDQPSWRNRQPEYQPASVEDFVADGESAQAIFNNTWWTHEAGVYQHVPSVTVGSTVTFSVYAYVWSSNFEDRAISQDAGGVTIQVGIDPTGELDPASDAIIWSDATETYDAYFQVEQSAVAESETITVWVKSFVDFPVQNSFVYLDNASLVVSTEEVVVEPTEEAIIDEEVVVEETTVPEDEEVVVEPTDEAIIDEEVVVEETTVPEDEEVVVEPTDEAIIDEEVVVEETTVPEDEEVVVEPTEEAIIDEEVVVEETAVPEDEEAVVEPTDEAIIDEEAVVEETAVPEDEEAVVEPTDEAIIDEEVVVEETTVPEDEEAVVEPTEEVIIDEEPAVEETATLEVVPTVEPTATAEPPATVAPTSTPIPPTVEPVATETPVVTPTAVYTSTPLPPTATPTPYILSEEEETLTDHVIHVVSRGETVGRIAAQYGSTVNIIRYANELNADNLIFIGQELVIPISPDAVVATVEPSVTPVPPTATPTPAPIVPTETPTQQPEVIEEPEATEVVSDVEEEVYVVQYGDTLAKIAWRYNVTVFDLAQRNAIVNVNRIYVGQQLFIPVPVVDEPEATEETATPEPIVTPEQPEEEAEVRYYTVQYGDSLYRISGLFNVTIDVIAEANQIVNYNLIYRGQVLIIP